ncbi:MAG TPA: type II toxin-antitoxin system prevent-host-death family antitoxin [Waddliaceae bacterium]
MSLMWQTQEAKAKFSQLVKVVNQGDQFITFRGEVVAVVISKKKYDELTKPDGSLLDFFKNAPLQAVDLDIERSSDLSREIVL